jgi:ABC-type sugar transport system permease subunit
VIGLWKKDLKSQPPGLRSPHQPSQSARTRGPLWQTAWLKRVFVVPSIIVFAAIMLYPFVQGVVYSFRQGSLVQLGGFVGLRNYMLVLQQDDFRNSLVFTAVFAAGTIVGSYIIGLVLALLLNAHLPAGALLRGALLLPWIIPSVVAAQGFRWLFNQQAGPIDGFLNAVGLPTIPFFSSASWAVVAVVVVKVWRSVPFMLISCLAALQTIAPELGEAAAMDGASRVSWFRYIAWPHIAPLSLLMFVMMAIFAIQDFETPYLMTQGGPGSATTSLMVLAYTNTFVRQSVGQGTAVAVFALLVLAVLGTTLLRSRRNELA